MRNKGKNSKIRRRSAFEFSYRHIKVSLNGSLLFHHLLWKRTYKPE